MEPFIHLPEFPIIICKSCQFAYVAKEADSHLRVRHSMPTAERQVIIQQVQAIPGIIQDQAGLQAFPFPPPTTKPIPFIAPPRDDGIACNACPYVIGTIQGIQKHHREEHGWVNDWKKGGDVAKRAKQERQVPWRTGVYCQRFFPGRAASRWFEVNRGCEEEGARVQQQGADARSVTDRKAAFLTHMHREDEEAFEQEAKARLIQDGDDKWEASKWLGRTGWPRHLEGIDQGELKALMRAIGDDEPELQQMWRVFNTVLDEAYAATERCYPGTAELFEIARKEVSSETPTMPFQGKMEENAWTKYKDKWRILLCIWVRVEFWDEEDRPKYRMTIGQRKAFELFSRAIHETITGADVVGRWTEDRVRRSCLDMVIQFLDHRFRNGDHYRSIIISALAIMGLADGGGDMDMVSGWLTAMDYTPTYSAVIKVARYLVLYQSILERLDQVGRLQQVMSEEEADEKAEGLFRIVRRKVRGFMTRTSGEEDAEPTPMNWIINTRTYGLRIRYTTPGSETIDWRGDQIIHGRIRIRMGEIADMLHNLVGRARETLSRLTMTEGGGAGEFTARGALPVIPWSQIEDQHGESIIDHSFLRNAGNAGWLAAGNDWVIKMIISRPDKWAEWMVEGAENNEYREHPYRGAAIRQYARDVEQFRGEIFMLMHMLGGQPARSTEILGLRMWNTMNGGVRNIFIHEGMVCFVTMYHKGFRQTGNTKIIHRYVPREVGELLVWYMWLVLPFWQNVQGRLKRKRRRSAFLWADEVVSEEGGKEGKIREVKVRAQDGGREEAVRESLGAGGEYEEDEEEEAAFMEWFREKKWTSDRVRRVIQRYSTEFSGHEINISAWRQMAIGISNRYFNKVFSIDDNSGDFEEEDSEEGSGNLVNSIEDLQAGHGSHVAGLIYARLFGQGDLGTMREREEFRKVSMRWHRFFDFGAEDRTDQFGSISGGLKRKKEAFDDEREMMRRKRFDRLHRIDIKGQLRQMMGPTAMFRGLQEKVIRAVARGEWPIVQVTPTGGGKSLTFMLPAYCTPDGVTVVITPLVSLQDDMAVRCQRLGIDAYIWKSREVQRAASLVFVTPESAVSKGFRTFVERMHGQQKLDRIVVDECHTVLGYSKTFRPQMGQLGATLQDFGVPVVCLTATLKPAQEMGFFRVMRFVPERVRVFREATTRPNIQYSVDIIEDGDSGRGRGAESANTSRKRSRSKAGRGAGVAVNTEGEEEGNEEDEALIERVCDIVRTWTAGHEQGKVIIYAGTIKRVKGIAERLGCMAYWRGVGNAAEKAQRVAEWMSSSGGESGWMAATNALGLGIDDPNVRLVMHAGMPRQLENFVQESGRGGRDGQKSESVVVIRRSWLREQTDEGFQQQQQQQCQDEWAWDRDAIEFIEGRVCRREVLDREMDGNIDRFGCAEGEEMCDICQGQQMTRDAAEAVEAEYGASSEIEEVMEEVMMAEEDYEKSQRLVRQVEAERRLQVMQEAKEVGEFEDLLAEWTGCCAVCKISESSEDVYHEMDACRHKGTERWVQLKEGIELVCEEMMTRKRFAKFSACFGCGLPQWICNSWVAASDDGRLFRKAPGKACQYSGGVIFHIMVAQRVRARDWWEGQMNKIMGRGVGERVDWEDYQFYRHLYGWLGELIEWGGRQGGGIQASRLCQVVIRIEQEWRKR